jgi:hypothetical protein
MRGGLMQTPVLSLFEVIPGVSVSFLIQRLPLWIVRLVGVAVNGSSGHGCFG